MIVVKTTLEAIAISLLLAFFVGFVLGGFSLYLIEILMRVK